MRTCERCGLVPDDLPSHLFHAHNIDSYEYEEWLMAVDTYDPITQEVEQRGPLTIIRDIQPGGYL